MDPYQKMYWELYHKVNLIIEELQAALADTEQLFLEEAPQEEKDRRE